MNAEKQARLDRERDEKNAKVVKKESKKESAKVSKAVSKDAS